MPYISKVIRKAIDGSQLQPASAGELNYALTRVIQKYLNSHPGYQGINDVVGALEGCKLEFYRRYAAVYEDQKIIENGDVY